ncbi:hypothetical protein DP939_25260 [Spongiactinospora rosea]|uniref:Uncharacterized protein n=2 Tax=Spongiactinospora rosea TaxID=2248750 RepID=A0A366LU22_9ACTN|nr:hypothetical protein DP939_25260 [Spongiactinospora rosea]
MSAEAAETAARSWAKGTAHAIASAFAVYAATNHLRRRRLPHPARTLATRRLDRGELLSVGELAALAHLPLDAAVPGMARAGARSVPPPPNVPRPGRYVKPLGTTDAGPARPVGVPVTSARHHLQIIGATGVGKSTLLAHQILNDAAAGRAVVVIDPKGDLVIDLLRRLPEGAAHHLVLLDPDDSGTPPALNVLAGADPDLATDNLVSIFRRIFAEFWGPRTDDILRSACLTLRHQPHATLADIPRLLGEETYRRAALARVRDEVLAGFWDWYGQLSAPSRSQAVGPLMNKLRAFLLRPYVRSIVGTPNAGLDMPHLLTTGGICLVRVPKGLIGEDTSRLLGSMVLAKVWEAAALRARLSEPARHDATLVVDEAHGFLNLSHGMADMLAEARAYRLSLVLAHQNLAQLSRDMREAISANARNKIIFNVSPEDARTLARQTLPNLTDHDLAHLGAYQAAARLLIDGADTSAFTFTTRPLPDPIPGREEQMRRAARRNAAHAVTTDSPTSDGRHPPHARPPAADPRRAPATPPAPTPPLAPASPPPAPARDREQEG